MAILLFVSGSGRGPWAVAPLHALAHREVNAFAAALFTWGVAWTGRRVLELQGHPLLIHLGRRKHFP